MAAPTRTTLSSACSADDNQIVVASATSMASGTLIKVDQEFMVIQQSYSTGTTIPVRRGQYGSKTVEHKVTAGVTYGAAAADFGQPGFAAQVQAPTAGRARYLKSRTASETFTDFVPGSDTTIVINGTAAVTLTFAAPTADQEGDELNIIGNGVAQHLLTFTGGLSGAGTSYDVITVNATAPAAFKFVAVNKLWYIYVGPALGGTVTNIIGSIA